jgi:hypothetical protein
MFTSVGIAFYAYEHFGPFVQLLVFKHVASGTAVPALQLFSLAVTVHHLRDDFIDAKHGGLLRVT